MEFITATTMTGAAKSGGASVNKQGQIVIMDWLNWMMLAGKCYQVRAGTITTPLIGNVPITDTAAEFCVDAVAGFMIMPMFANISVRLGSGTAHEYAIKSVNVVSSAGTAFVPLPLRNLGTQGATAPAARTTARVAATAGTVTVTAETATTTRRHWSYANPVAAGAGHSVVDHNWQPRMTPFLAGPVCLYTQLGAATTGPSYYANLDYAEIISDMLF